MSSAIFASMVCAAMMRQAVTGSLLADAVHAVDGLGLLRRGPAELGEHDVRRGLQVEADTGRGERADRDRDLRVVVERVDLRPGGAARLVAADRDRLEAALGEGLLRGIHHVDVLGEEHDLADRARQLRGVVGGEHRLGLADLAHHREDVLAGLGGLRLLELGVGDDADELAGALVDSVLSARLTRARW